MKRAAIGTFCTILLLLMVFGPGMETRGQDVPPPKTTLIVKLAAGVTLAEGQAAIERHGGTLKSSIGPLRMLVIEVPTDSAPTIMAELREDPAVERVEEDRSRKLSSIPSDALYASQWALTKIAWSEVYGTATFTGQVDVAVLDTGIDASHPDLIGAIGPGTSFLDDSDGRTDLNGHGTWVSGIVAGRTNNLDGIAGVGYSNVQILPVKVLNAAGEGQDSDIISGILWAVDHHASVILMAFSNPGFSQNLQDAIDYAWDEGTVLVAAAGNDGSNAGTFPAGDKSVIGVSATDENDDFATGSNYGPSIFMAAPGTNIVSTYKDGAYISWSGTSASAAMVAGAAALIRSSDPTLSNGAVVGRLARNADPAGTQEETGNGRLQIARALADTETDEVRPAGSSPVGEGGPFVGPYRAASRNFTVNFVGTGSVTISIDSTGADASNTLSFGSSCTGTGSGSSSITITGTCTSLQSGTGNNATLIFSASAGTFGGWSLPSNFNSSTCSGATNPCHAILGSNAAITATFIANPAPTATGQTLSTAEDTALPITLAGTDTTPAALTFSIVSGPSPTSGTLGTIGAPSCSAGNCTAAVTFTPTANYNGPASFTFRTNDGSQDSTAATVNITVTPVNDTPTAGDTTLSGAEDAGDILINFGPLVSDLETLDANLTYEIVSPPSSGSLTGAGQHRSFTPASNFVGSVTFTYKVTDRGDPDNCTPVSTTCAAALSSAVKTVTINISPINDKPTASDLTTANVPEDSTTGVSFDLGTLVSDVETSDANLNYTIVSGPTVAQGTLTGTLPNQTFVPAADFNGTVLITYKVTDRGDPDNCGTPSATCAAALDSDTKTITIVVTPVNDAPVATDGTFSGTEDGAAIAIDLGTLVSDVETVDALLTYAIVAGPDAAQGTLSGSGQNRSFTPAANFNGPATFTFKVTDRGDPDNCTPVGPTCTAPLISDVKTVTINISAVNDKPGADNFTTANIEEDSVAGVSFDLSAHVSDIETDDAFLTYHIVSGPTPAQGTLTGTLPNQTFVPAANFNGTVSITYDVTDRGDPDNCSPGPSCSAALASDIKTITIVVTPVNDAPVAIDGTASGAEDGGAIAIDLGTLATDLETADANLTYTIMTPPASGALGGLGQNRTFTPAANVNGQVTFTFKVTDRGDPDNCGVPNATCAAPLESDTKTVTITIAPVNDPPVANNLTPDSIAEDSGSVVAFDLSTLVSDVETSDANLTYNIVSGPTAAQGTLTGTLPNQTFTPAANFNGTVLITYNVTDRGDPDNCSSGPCDAAQTSDTKTITIVVTPVNDKPVAYNGSFSGAEDDGAVLIDLGDLVSDVETGDANLTYTITDGPTPLQGTLTAGQNPSFTPAANFNGVVTFKYKVTDRGDPDNCLAVPCAAVLDSDTKTVTITITPVNDKPVANNLTTASIPEDSAVGVSFDLSTLVSDVETSDANLTYNIVSGPTAAQGTLTGTLPNQTFTPAANFNGTVLITYNVTDRGDPDDCSSGPCDAAQTSDTKTITIVVTPVNDIPYATDGAFTGDEDVNIPINLRGLVSDLETSDPNLTYTIVSGPSSGTLTPGASAGYFTYLGALNFFGDVEFTYKVTDRGDPDNCGAVGTSCAAAAISETKTVTIHVLPVNDAPGVTASSANASAQYSDPPAPAMKITVVDVDTAGMGLTLTSIQVNGGYASGLTASVTNTSANSREWTIGQVLLAPGTYTVRVNVSDGFLPGWVEFTLTVTKEDADITYSGVVFFSTSSVSSNTGTATFSATITDKNDGAGTRGDIRNAKVTFVNRENANTPFPGCSNLPVGLVNPGDLKVGTATCQTVLTTGSGDSDTYMVGIIVNNYYTRDNPYDDELVTIYKPIGTYFITGGGHLVLTNPAGAYAGDVGSRNNFGYNVKYNKTGKNLQGNFNSIVRKNGRVYQIKATAMTSLNVNPPAGCPNATVAAPCSAVFTSKANMTDITDPLHTMGLGGSLVLQVTITDKGQPGNADSIGISVFDQDGGLLFSSNWNGATTVELPLTGGNQVVH